jgi:DNA-binding MarR family transcriptional regulator
LVRSKEVERNRLRIAELREVNTGRLLLRASRVYSDRAMADIRRLGHAKLSLTHAAILPHIELEGTRLTALAEAAGMTKPSVSQLVDELEAAGYVERTPDAEDKRAQKIMFTALGWRFLDDASRVKEEIEADISRVLGAKGTTVLRDLLTRFPSISAKPGADAPAKRSSRSRRK